MKPFFFICLFLVFVSCKKTDMQLTKITAETMTIDNSIKPLEAIDSMITPYKEELIAEMQQVLTYTPKDLLKNDGNKQSSLGNLMVDICFEIANPIFKNQTKKPIDFAMLNHGGIRATISKGKVTKEHAFQLMPFENELVVVEITGEKIIELVDYFIKSERAHPLSKDVELIIDKNGYDLKIKGLEFDKNKRYTVLTSDYLQNGGSKMNFFKTQKS